MTPSYVSHKKKFITWKLTGVTPYLETKNHSTVKISKPLAWVKEKLENELFIQCHRSYLVNKSMIHTIDIKGQTIHLLNESSIPISARKLRKVIKRTKKQSVGSRQ